MNTEAKNAVYATDTEARYDERAKRLLGNKFILAHILVKTVDEFQGMDPKDVVPLIEGEPVIGSAPTEPGLTNTEKAPAGECSDNNRRIVGLNTESAEINEGLVRFDIIFYVRSKDGLTQIIVNLEAQKDEPSGYHIINRAVFYACRLISSQKERDFSNTNYNDIKRVFSIWICMNMEKNNMSFLHLTKKDVIDSYQWKGRLDLLNIVLIGIADSLPEHDTTYALHRLLSALFSTELSVTEKLGIIESEYSIPLNSEIREDVDVMCNLSQGIKEKSWAEGEAKGEAQIIIKMYHKGYTAEQIADITEKSITEIESLIQGKTPMHM